MTSPVGTCDVGSPHPAPGWSDRAGTVRHVSEREDGRPDIDVVIACHDPARPVARAVRSVLQGKEGLHVRVTVVAHNTDPAGMHEVLGADLLTTPSGTVRVIGLGDGVRSPAGPFNLGLARATAPYVSIMGSDDRLEAGALESWRRIADRHWSDVVVPRLRHARGALVRTPVVRPVPRPGLDLVRDRLAYRTAPLGLIRREVLDRLDLRLTDGLPSGEDVAFSTRLWASAGRIDYARRSPAYVIGDDAEVRVTSTPRPVVDEFAFVEHLMGAPWFGALDDRARTAVVTKLIRVHVFGAVHNRSDPGRWTPAERAALREVTTALTTAAPRALDPLSLADARLLDAILDTSVATPDLLARARARRRFGSPATVVTRRPDALLHREGPLRFMAASALLGR